MLFYAANITKALIAAGIILIPGAPLLAITLNANVLATVLLPVTLVFVSLLASDRQLMGGRANTVSLNVAGAAIVTVVAGCGAAYGIDSFLQAAQDTQPVRLGLTYTARTANGSGLGSARHQVGERGRHRRQRPVCGGHERHAEHGGRLHGYRGHAGALDHRPREDRHA
jgi:hypothetical protein